MGRAGKESAKVTVDDRSGVPPRDLADGDLTRELRHLHRTREETFFAGSVHALEHHTSRMLALEAEYARRHPRKVRPAPGRTRASARKRGAAPRKAKARSS